MDACMSYKRPAGFAVDKQKLTEKSRQPVVHNALKMPSTVIITFFLLSIASVLSLPINRKARRSTADPSSVVTMSSSVYDMLTDNGDESKGLYSVFKAADFLTKNELFTPEV